MLFSSHERPSTDALLVLVESRETVASRHYARVEPSEVDVTSQMVLVLCCGFLWYWGCELRCVGARAWGSGAKRGAFHDEF